MDSRVLGPQLIADGWIPIASDSMMWPFDLGMVLVMLVGPWRHSSFAPPWRDYPGEIFCCPADEAYGVSMCRLNVLGEPDSGFFEGVVTTSYARALKLATDARARLLEKPTAPTVKQLTFDDLLEARQ